MLFSLSWALRGDLGKGLGPSLWPRSVLWPCHCESSHGRKDYPAPSFLSLSLCLWLLFETLALLTRILLPFRNVECLNLLLSSGADLRRRDKFGRCVDTQE